METKRESPLCPPIECPQCGSSFVDRLKDPNTDEIIQSPDRRMFACKFCKHIFPVFSDEARVLPIKDIIASSRATGFDKRWLVIGIAIVLLGAALRFGWLK